MMKRKNRHLKIAAIIGALFGLSTLTFNCAPRLFNAAVSEGSFSSMSVDPFAKVNSPWMLLNSESLYKSMLNVTGQSNKATAAQLNEYTTRQGVLPQDTNLSSVSSPMQIAATSMAGEVCNGLIAVESAANASRKFFVGVNFSAAPGANDPQAFVAATQQMAQSFYGRSLSVEESQALSAFYMDFTNGLTTVAGTKSLYLATCAAMLSSTDAVIF